MALVRRATGSPPPAACADPQLLIAALADADAERRRRAVLGLGGVGAAIPAVLERVHDGDAAVREAALTVLAAHDSAEVAAGLAVHLRSEDAALRTAVVEALAAMPTGVLPLLAQLVLDPDPDVRILTAMVLAHLPSPQAVRWLVEMISADRHPNVVAAAVDALLPLAGAEHAPLLRAARTRFADDPFLRFTIDAALPRLGG
ncbi:HEAT repeat domain-containing protein [Planomonospora sp. ID82291]|uniref:HEAT repeat domain-containing protein n=1 Tax=Planomonospora sp. ID82291 TaxID=2738136 RepID=UPI0018C39C10|nr:HEAT repeat domain-containing protein [Planomonospora sp. ID82291]MBG0818596.1 HEAT repeat domain-containing protein [Planomonospora sp. ID82291]